MVGLNDNVDLGCFEAWGFHRKEFLESRVHDDNDSQCICSAIRRDCNSEFYIVGTQGRYACDCCDEEAATPTYTQHALGSR